MLESVAFCCVTLCSIRKLSGTVLSCANAGTIGATSEDKTVIAKIFMVVILCQENGLTREEVPATKKAP